MASIANTLVDATNLYSMGIKFQINHIRSTVFFTSLKRDLNNASIIQAAGAGGEYIDFQVPTPFNGSVVNDAGLPYWGDGTNLDKLIRYKFVVGTDRAGNTLPKLTEESLGVDINGDADTADEYEMGSVVKVILNADKTEDTSTIKSLSAGSWLLRDATGTTKLFARVNLNNIVDMTTGENVRVTILSVEKTKERAIPHKLEYLICPLNQVAVQ